MNMSKRLLSLLLMAVLIMGLFPASALTASAETGKTYEIKSFADLKLLADLSKTKTFEDDTIELLADIELTDENREVIKESALSFGSYAAIGSSVPFSGTFNGNGHTISGLNYGASLSVAVSTALFSYTKGATIRDLTICDSTLDADMLGGILIGYAENTTVVNTAVSGCNLSVNCVDNVLTLITDGGMVGGGLIGKASGCTLYNCEVSNTYVHTSATGAVQALGGKGLYMGAMVGSATGTTIEYSRVINGSRVKNSYDIAVGALGGNKVYAGGIAGEIKSGTKIIDSFSTAGLYTYCGTYVSVGAGNIGYVGGIAAASYGDNEITRCHYAGNATSKQYNAAIVIPIIQTNKNVSGISERIKDGTLTVTGSYFRPGASPETSMKVLGDTTATAEYGPQDDVTYADRSFWEGHDYDFAGTVSRSSGYSADHANKWVMDCELGIPVHGQSVAAGFDFPGAGSVTIGATDLVNTKVTTDDAYDFAVQGFKPTTTSYAADLTAAANDNFRFVEWYRIPDVTASSAPEGHEYFAAMMKEGTDVSKDSEYSKAECTDNDLFLAHMEALVQFHDIDGDVIDKSSGEDNDNDNNSDDWYDFEDALPDVKPADHTPDSETARLIGWTTEKSTEAGGGYSSITNGMLTKLRLAGSFYQTGDPVEKPMELYPVYADLVSNVITIHEGNEQDSSEDESLREGVGKTWVSIDENNVATIHVGGEESTDNKLTKFPEGYRFIGWYTDDGNGKQVRVSQEQEYTLNGVDLTTEHTYTARFEYRIQFWLPARYGKNANRYVAYSHKFGEVWTSYKDVIFTATADYNWVSSYTAGLEIAYKRADWRLKYWTDAAIRTNDSGYIEYEDYKASGSYHELVNDEVRAPRYANSGVTEPTELSAITNFGENQLQHMYYVETDFPGSGKSEIIDYGYESANLDVRVTLNSGYNFIFYDLIGKMSDSTLLHGKYAYKNSSGTLRNLTFESPDKVTWDSDEQLQANGNYTYYYTAHITADVNFHQPDGTLIAAETLTREDYPYQSGDKEVTLTRRYQSELFGNPDKTSYTTYEKKAETSVTFATSERGTAPEDPVADGYFFAGWAEISKMADYERAYVFDISSGESIDGAPQYVSSSADRARAYTLKDDAPVEHTMELYPVYVPLGKITTTTNLSAAKSESLTVPDDPAYTVTAAGDNGTQTIRLQADTDTPLPGNKEGFYELLRMTVSADGGEETELTGNLKTGEFSYDNIQPGHSYLFTACYQPYAVIFHQNGTDEMVTQIYNQYEPIRNTPLPAVQDSNRALDNCLFAGWTEQVPENSLYLAYNAGEDEAVTYDKLDNIYHFADDGTSVSHSMELWPVYINIRIKVNSNIDDELTKKGIDPGTIRKVDRSAADSLQTRAAATEVEGYKFYGWYRDIPSDSLTDDSEYTKDRLVSTDSSYRLTGDSPYEPVVYTARYLKVYKVVYHNQNGEVLATDYIYEDDDHPFEKQETLKDADGNIVKDESGNAVAVSVPYFPDAISALHEGLTDCQVFETWIWIKSDGKQVEYGDFCSSNIISKCISEDTEAGREMHLYPVVWSMSAKDSKSEAYDEMLFGGRFDSTTDTVSAYFIGDKPYCQPSVTVHAEKSVWTGNGGAATAAGKGQENILVTLYPDDNSAAKLMGTEQTDAEGDAVFAITSALTIEKRGGTELAGESFLFTVTNRETEETQTVSLTCLAAEDGTAATGSVTLLLPAGIYSVTEDETWAYRYSAEYTVSYAVTAADDCLTNTAVAVTPVGSTGAEVTCTNTEKSNMNGWINDAAHKENIFD